MSDCIYSCKHIVCIIEITCISQNNKIYIIITNNMSTMYLSPFELKFGTLGPIQVSHHFLETCDNLCSRHRYTNYIFSYKMCLVPYFTPTYFIWVYWCIKPNWNTKFAIQNELWPSNIFHSKLIFNQWISKALNEFWSSLYYHHKNQL